MKKPNLFIIGAPKCGTTFLYHYLKEHPDIYFPDFKEPHFFGSDLIRRHGAYNLNLEEYQNLFKTDKKVIGEASTFYIFSKESAKEIYNFNPKAKIIIMMRDLVDLVHSMHSQFVFSGDEIVEDFKEALDLENERLNGRNIPDQTTVLNKLFYINNILSLPQNIKSFIDYFKEDNIKFIFLDDIRNNPNKVFFDTLKFLNVDTNIDAPKFKIINQNKIYKSRFIRNFIKKYSIGLGKIRSFFSNKPLGIIRLLESFNKEEISRDSISNSLRDDLSKKFNNIDLKLKKIANKNY
tara:strand:- start:138 stop:1016 length:879 start_codon:yes stop_codon:yes gene_type:complete